MSSKKFIARFGVDNNNHPLSNVASPTHSTDAATKGITDIIDTKAGFAFSQANLAFSQANTAFTAANNVGPQLEPSFNRANAAYDQANTGTTQAQAAFLQANTGTTQAQAAFLQANNATTQAQAAFGQANNSYSQANNATTQAQAAFGQANNSYSQANNATTQAQAAFVQANTAYTTANSKFNSIGGNITGAVTISSNLTVTGNLTVSGNVTTVSANNLILKDNMFYLNSDSSVTNPDLGFAGNYNDGIYHHAGFFRDASDGYWKVFDNYLPEPDASPNIDTSNSSFRIANFQANTISATSFSGAGANLTGLTAGNLYGTIPSAVLANSTHYVGTTAIALNRASASQTLTGVSIDGNAGSVAWTGVTGKPTTLSGYGITDAASSSAVSGTSQYLPKFTSASVIGNSEWYIDANSDLRCSQNRNLYSRHFEGTDGGSGAGALYLNYHQNTHDVDLCNGKLIISGTNYTQASGSLRAPIFYDSNDTGYYVCPTSTSHMINWKVRTTNTTNASYNASLGNEFIQWPGGTGCAGFSFHRLGVYAVNMALDNDNIIRIGGWSAAANRLQLDMSGNLTAAGSVTAYSDIRLKENIEIIENPIDKIKQIRGVTFTRNDQDDKTKRHAGVIAQEVEVVLPEVISEDNEGIKNVAYGNMIGLLIEAIKEQQSKIERLESQINKIIN